MLEATVEQWLVTTTAERGGWCAKMIDAGRRGAPDRELRMPGGRVYFIETKKPTGGRLSTWQQRYHQRLRDLGFSVAVFWTVDGINDFWLRYDRLWDKHGHPVHP